MTLSLQPTHTHTHILQHTHIYTRAHKEPWRRAVCIGVQHHANFHCCDKNKQVWGAESEGPRVTAHSSDNGAGRWGVGQGLRLNYLDPARQPHITVTSLFGKAWWGRGTKFKQAMDVCWQDTVFKGTLKWAGVMGESLLSHVCHNYPGLSSPRASYLAAAGDCHMSEKSTVTLSQSRKSSQISQ